MRPRVPLYAKILGWFFLNVMLLIGAFAILLHAHFSFDLEWLFTSGARDRFEGLRDLIRGELNATPPEEWPEIMERYSEAQGVRFGLYDDGGRPLVGSTGALPEAVRERLRWWLEFGRGRGPRGGSPEFPPSRAEDRPWTGERPESPRRGWRPPVRALVRTSGPTQYWLVTSTRLDNPQAGDSMRVLLAAQADSLASGGLIFDIKPWLAIGLGSIAFSLLFWIPLIRGITRSIAQMTNATRQIADGRFDVRVDARRSDELGSMGKSVNEMAARLDGFVKGQKRFLGDIAHELCSPLAKLQMALGVLEQQTNGAGAKYTRTAQEKAEQMATLVSELLYFSKASFAAPTAKLSKVSVRDAVERAMKQEGSEGAIIEVSVPADLLVLADAELLVRALGNLIRNAMRYAGAAGPIAITATGRDSRGEITVADRGPGVPAEELPRIFDAFYRPDTSRQRGTGGMGLGLTIVKTCVESCGGAVAARNREPHGFTVMLTLPLA